jgi:pimeloyl-ACP methyl ester carboxylesterase
MAGMEGSNLLARALAAALAAALACACGDDGAPAPGASPPEDAPTEAALPASPAPAAPTPPPPAPDPTPAVPTCSKAPCAARPIVFVHGHNGSSDDFQSVLDALVTSDGRFDAYRFVGTSDPPTWPTGSIPRRAWLFAFDYYVQTGTDARGSFTAGPGRIGSDAAYACTAPVGAGHLVSDGTSYEQGVTHDYATDLASAVTNILRATGADSVDIVAHSLGGLVTRSYLAFFGGNAVTKHVLLLASPHLGVPVATLEGILGLGGAQSWMTAHELTELDSGSVFAKSRFSRCGDAAKGSWTSKLLEVEQQTPIVPEVHVMSGTRDLLVSYGAAHHPQAITHVVVDGVDHAGLLKAPETIARVEALCGGSYP